MENERKFTPLEMLRILGWTNKEAAEKLSVSEMTIVRRKNGSSNWKMPEILIMSKAADIPVDRIAF